MRVPLKNEMMDLQLNKYLSGMPFEMCIFGCRKSSHVNSIVQILGTYSHCRWLLIRLSVRWNAVGSYPGDRECRSHCQTVGMAAGGGRPSRCGRRGHLRHRHRRRQKRVPLRIDCAPQEELTRKHNEGSLVSLLQPLTVPSSFNLRAVRNRRRRDLAFFLKEWSHWLSPWGTFIGGVDWLI